MSYLHCVRVPRFHGVVKGRSDKETCIEWVPRHAGNAIFVAYVSTTEKGYKLNVATGKRYPLSALHGLDVEAVHRSLVRPCDIFSRAEINSVYPAGYLSSLEDGRRVEAKLSGQKELVHDKIAQAALDLLDSITASMTAVLTLPALAEDATILRHYHLDSLDDDEWADDVHNRSTARESALQQFTRAPIVALPEPEFEDEQEDILDESDPLGLKESIFKGTSKQSVSNRNTASMSELKERKFRPPLFCTPPAFKLSPNQPYTSTLDSDSFLLSGTSLIISNKTFNPRHFLLTVHRDTSYADLIAGVERLKLTVDQRSEALKALVHANFDRFVGAKNTIDHVYDEMKAKKLNSQEEYGTRALGAALSEGTRRAQQIFGPVIERREKAEKIRSTLVILERYKFFFNLPSSLLESTKQTKYETAIRDYKKGKYLYSTLKGDANGDDAGGLSASQDTDITDLHRKVFDKVWTEVEKIVVELRDVLFKQLAEPWRSMEEQEKTINFLFDLDTTNDPAWFYLDSQYKWIVGLLNETYEENAQKIEGLILVGILRSLVSLCLMCLFETGPLKVSTDTSEKDKRRSISLKKVLGLADIRDIETALVKETDVQIWRATLNVVKSLSDLLLRCLPDFWKLSKSFIDGKFQNKAAVASLVTNKRRRQGVDLAKVEQCQIMAREVVSLYASLISRHFSLSTPIVAARRASQIGSADDESPAQLPPFLPPNANSVTTCYFLTRTITELANCVNDINAINLAGEAFVGLTKLMEDTRWRFIEVLCECWARDAKTFYQLEDWNPDADNVEVTAFLRLFHSYHKYCARSAFKIGSLTAVSDNKEDRSKEVGGGLEEQPGQSIDVAYRSKSLMILFSSQSSVEQKPKISSEYLERIRGTFLDSLYSFLDGLVHLAFSEYSPLLPEKDDSALKRSKIDVNSMDSRILLTVSNLSHLRASIIPKLVNLFEAAYHTQMTDELKVLCPLTTNYLRFFMCNSMDLILHINAIFSLFPQTLIDVVDQLDGILFDDYIKRKTQNITEIVKRGILLDGVDWYSISKPTEVHSFIYEALLSLVIVHAQVSGIAKRLVHRTLSALLENMAQDCLESFQQVDRFGMGGMLQATLEIEFMHQTLSQYVTPVAAETLQQIYSTIEAAYDPQQQHSNNLQTELNSVKKLLVDSRKSTAVQFLCFKKVKDGSNSAK
ncbi:exocyst complex component Sec5-domain-containing protein [Jimgerdemannia flammicorona]|uniref:Exocyst complex component SEC5 n=1 Tax=Jimgerdemannia flammicorona TaxID=994334 RepID=A0A433QY61_9FUNG|nr:exocyst complex component Sec5-domain-containing protein [Jimgerdemannia flammicorona]